MYLNTVLSNFALKGEIKDVCVFTRQKNLSRKKSHIRRTGNIKAGFYRRISRNLLRTIDS